jgi:O-antigen/teichoic acid export membrane protein
VNLPDPAAAAPSPRANLLRIAGNTASLLTNDVVTKASTFFIYALISRYLGAFQFGQMTLALSLLYTLQVLAPAGLEILITREIARDRSKTNLYLVNGSLVSFLASLVSIAILQLVVSSLHYSPDTIRVISLVSISLVPFSLFCITEAVFKGWERMQYISYANVPPNVIKVLLVFGILSQGLGLPTVGWILLFTNTVILAVEWWLLVRKILRPTLTLDLGFSLRMTRTAATFLGYQSIIAFTGTFIYIFLSKAASETQVGLFSAANQLMAPVLLLIQSIVNSLFPIMCQKYDTSLPALKQITDRLIELLLTIALPTTVFLFFCSGNVLKLFYGNAAFLQASIPLRIMVAGLIVKVFTAVLGSVLLASQREKLVLLIVVITTISQVLLGAGLISRFGLIGAAVASILSDTINLTLHYTIVAKLLSGIDLIGIAWKPFVASLCMGLFLAWSNIPGLWPALILSSLVFVGVWAGLFINSQGGLGRIIARYQEEWAK